MKGNAKKATLKIHSLANFTALKYLRRTQNATRRPGRATATSPGQSDQGERHPGCEAHPERTPLEGAKAHSVCFLLLLLQSAVHAGGLPRVSARFAHLALGWWLIAPLGRTCPQMDSSQRGTVNGEQSRWVLKFRGGVRGCSESSEVRRF